MADLPANLREVTVAGEIRLPVGTRMDDAEREIIRRTIEAYPTLKDAARVLGIGLRTLHTKLNVLGIRPATGPRSAGRQRARDPEVSGVPERHSGSIQEGRHVLNRHILGAQPWEQRWNQGPLE